MLKMYAAPEFAGAAFARSTGMMCEQFVSFIG